MDIDLLLIGLVGRFAATRRGTSLGFAPMWLLGQAPWVPLRSEVNLPANEQSPGEPDTR